MLKAIISPVMHEGENATWPPRDPEALKLMEKVRTNIAIFSLLFFTGIFHRCLPMNLVYFTLPHT